MLKEIQKQCKNCSKSRCIKGLTKKMYICEENSNMKAHKYAWVKGNAQVCEDYKER